MNAALSCKRFGCASFGQFKHVVFKIYHVPFSKSKSGIMVYRILLEKRFIGFETRYRPIWRAQCCAQLKSFGNKTFFLVFPLDLNMNAALSCKRFGCASFGQFKHAVFKIYHVPFSKSKSGIMVYRILLEKRFIGFVTRYRPIRLTQC